MDSARYEIIGGLDENGAMADVLLARDKQTNEQVVIKFMKLPEDIVHDHNRRRRFDWEVNIARTVRHPHVLRAIDDGDAVRHGHNVPFLVYPYIEGGSLQKLLVQAEPWKSWTLPQLADLIMQAAEGLHYLHTLNPPIAHLDVKPGNFLLKEEPVQRPDRKMQLWLSDFGIARWQREESYQTQNVVGTFVYMAPEQLQGYISISSDQYALALVARYLFTGYPPRSFASDHGIRTPLTELNPARLKSPEIDDVLARALAIYPEQRFPTILDFAQALHSAVMRQLGLGGFHDEPTEAFPQERLSEILQGSTQPQVPPRPTWSAPVPTPPTEPVSAEIAQPVPQEPIQFKDIPLPSSPPSSHTVVNRPLPPEKPANKEVHIQRTALSTFPLRELARKEMPAQPAMLSWSPDGASLLSTFYGQEPPRLLDRDGRIEIIASLPSAHLASWSPDSRMLALSVQEPGGAMSRICLWSRERPGEQPMTVCMHNTPSIDGLDWSRRGQLAVWVEPQILVYTLSSQRVPLPRTLVAERPLLHGNLGTLRWSPDGAWLAAGTDDGALLCWRAGNDMPTFQVPPAGARIYSLAWSDDGVLLAVAFQNKRVGIWNMRELRQIGMWEGLSRVPQMLSIAAREHTLVAATMRGLLFGAVDNNGPVAQYPGQVLAVWSPTGSELATLDVQRDTTVVVLQR